MALDRRIKKIIKKVSQEHNLSERNTELAALIQFMFAKEVISNGKFESIRLRFFGKFLPAQGRLKRRAKRLKELEELENLKKSNNE